MQSTLIISAIFLVQDIGFMKQIHEDGDFMVRGGTGVLELAVALCAVENMVGSVLRNVACEEVRFGTGRLS